MGEIILPADIVPNTEKDVVLNNAQLRKGFDALISEKNPIFLSMLGYMFYRAVPSNKRPKPMQNVKPKLAVLMQYDDKQYERLKEREQDLMDTITESEMNKFFKHYLSEIEKTNMLSIIEALSENGYFPQKNKKIMMGGKEATEVIIDKPLKLNERRLQSFKLSQLDNESAIERLVDITERGQEPDEEGSERSGELMSAIDSGKPILYEMIKKYFDYSEINMGALITLDTKQYVNDVFVREGFGAFDSENFAFRAGLLGGETITPAGKDYSGEEYEAETKPFSEKDTRNNIPLLHLKLIGDKGAGKYEQGKDKFLVEGLKGSKSFDTLEEAYDAIDEISTKPKLLEKYLEKIIMSQDKHPLKNIIYGYLSAERRKLKLGTLEIQVSKTKEGSIKDKQKWVKSIKNKLNLEGIEDMKTSNKEIKKIVMKLKEIINFFEDIDRDELRTRIENAADSTKPMLTRGQKRQLEELEEKDKKLEFKINNKDKDEVKEQKREKKRQLKELRQIEINQKEYFLEDEDDESNFQIILDLFKSFKELSNSPDLYLTDLFEEYEAMKQDGYLTSEEVENIEESFADAKSPLFLAMYKYAKELMSTSKFSGFSTGKSRIPILYADVIYDMNTLLDTTPKNYKFRIKKPKKGEESTSMNMDVVRVQKDFLNIKRGYNSLRALVGGN